MSIDTETADITAWHFPYSYDAIVVVATLQHLKDSDALALLQKMKEHTNPGGVHAISLFTNSGDMYAKDSSEDPGAFYPSSGWLKDHYSDWDVVSYSEASGTLAAKRPDGTPMENMTAYLLAKKRS